MENYIFVVIDVFFCVLLCTSSCTCRCTGKLDRQTYTIIYISLNAMEMKFCYRIGQRQIAIHGYNCKFVSFCSSICFHIEMFTSFRRSYDIKNMAKNNWNNMENYIFVVIDVFFCVFLCTGSCSCRCTGKLDRQTYTIIYISLNVMEMKFENNLSPVD